MIADLEMPPRNATQPSFRGGGAAEMKSDTTFAEPGEDVEDARIRSMELLRQPGSSPQLVAGIPFGETGT